MTSKPDEFGNKEYMENFVACLAAIPAGKPGTTGEVVCPKCKKGKIRYSFARSNGHLWASCSTEKCFTVIQ